MKRAEKRLFNLDGIIKLYYRVSYVNKTRFHHKVEVFACVCFLTTVYHATTKVMSCEISPSSYFQSEIRLKVLLPV